MNSQMVVDAVLDASRAWIAAFNRQDAIGCGNAYTARAQLRGEPLATLSGRNAIVAFWQGLMDAGYRDVQYLDPQVEVLSDGRARLTSPWAMNFARGMIHDEQWVLEADGVWRLSSDHFEIIDGMEIVSTSHVVLVHGAWMGAWCWDKVVQALASSHIRVTAIDLPAHGTKAALGAPDLGCYVDALSAELETIKGSVILVGHSFGGLVISQTAEALPQRVRALVYLSAFLLPDQGAFMSAVEGVEGSLVLDNLVFSEDGGVVGVAPDRMHAAVAADVPAEFFETLQPKWVLEPTGPLASPLALSRARWGRIPRYYIETTQDHAIPIEVQRAMYGAHQMAGVATLTASHCSMLSVHNEVAASIRRVCDVFGELESQGDQ